MKNYSVEITVVDNGRKAKLNQTIKAENTTELAAKFQALEQINRVLKHEDFMTAKQLLIEKPQLVPVIKEVVEDAEDLSETQLLLKAPKIIKKFIKVLKE
jgi:hypothetical protein